MKIQATISPLTWFWRQTISKYMGIEERFVWWVGQIKPRASRLINHLVSIFKKRKSSKYDDEIGWWTTLGIYTLEFFAVSELYESITSLFKYNTRPLTKHEMAVGLSVFGESINFDLVRMDERAYLGPKQRRFAYVAFHTINAWGEISDAHLVHEFVHIWQYEKYGAMYIPKALKAQRSEAHYDYGGVEMLVEFQNIGLRAFNFEQQADIIGDYYRIKHHLRPLWGKGTEIDLPIYEIYVNELSQ